MSNFQEDAYNQIQSVEQPTEEHKASWSHEFLAGAAAFEAMRAYEQKQEREGANPDNDHHMAKEILAGLVAASVDALAESKGMDWIDRERAKQQAKEETKKLYAEKKGADLQ